MDMELCEQELPELPISFFCGKEWSTIWQSSALGFLLKHANNF